MNPAGNLRGAFAKYKLTGAADDIIGRVALGDVTLAAMTKDHTEKKEKSDVEEEEQEVYGIFTGSKSSQPPQYLISALHVCGSFFLSFK